MANKIFSNEEPQKNKLDALRSYLVVGAEQAGNGEFVENFSMDTLIRELDADVTIDR